MENQGAAIQHVSDTAVWVAYYRALETKRPDALFQDPFAEMLVGARGEKISRSMGSSSKYTRWTVTIRTVIIDLFIERMIAEGVDTILNLGAGLDARPYRMSLPGTLRWIEADFPKMIEYKEKALASSQPRCRLERVKIDLTDRSARKEFLEQINKSSKKVLVITEGVLPYLSPAEVGDLATDMHACDHINFWVAEFFAKEVYRYLNNPRRVKKMRNAPFRFFPDDYLGFFKNVGWVPRETKYLGEEAVRLNRKPPIPWWTFIFRPFVNKERAKKFQRMTGFILFSKV